MDDNELQATTLQLPSGQQPQQISIRQEQSGNGKAFGYVQHYVSKKLTTVFLPMDEGDDDDTPDAQIALDLSCYNLFVIADETFRGKYFDVPKNRAIAVDKCTPDDLLPLAFLTEECIGIVKRFPAIFASTNHQFARTDNHQKAFFGIVRDVRVMEEGIRVYFYKYRKFGQQLLNEHAADFGIGGTEFRNELDETHWAIKRLDVVETLNNNGCTIKLF